MGGQDGQSPGGPQEQEPPSSRQKKRKIISPLQLVKLLTDLQILDCELHKNAFGGRAPLGEL